MLSTGMGAPKPKKTYSAEWAIRIYIEYKEKAPRATDFVAHSLGIPERDLVSWLRTGDERWEIFKACRKLAVRLGTSHPVLNLIGSLGLEQHSTGVEHVRKNVHELWQNRLKSIDSDIAR